MRNLDSRKRSVDKPTPFVLPDDDEAESSDLPSEEDDDNDDIEDEDSEIAKASESEDSAIDIGTILEQKRTSGAKRSTPPPEEPLGEAPKGIKVIERNQKRRKTKKNTKLFDPAALKDKSVGEW